MKKVILIMVFSFMALLCAYASSTSTVQLRYLINRYVEDSIIPFFTDTNKNTITTYAVDLESDLSSPQIFLALKTNITSVHDITLSFTVMSEVSGTGTGYYDVRVYNGDYDVLVNKLSFTSTSDISCTFDSEYTDSASTTSTFYYPIAFAFSDYIGSYNASDDGYSATITVEVTGQ